MRNRLYLLSFDEATQTFQLKFKTNAAVCFEKELRNQTAQKANERQRVIELCECVSGTKFMKIVLFCNLCLLTLCRDKC